uniref:Uncharacterized protein n=1 Tax=Buteo japonicus TaxID=224669 RepID=A0A8C0BLE5_9AVES
MQIFNQASNGTSSNILRKFRPIILSCYRVPCQWLEQEGGKHVHVIHFLLFFNDVFSLVSHRMLTKKVA